MLLLEALLVGGLAAAVPSRAAMPPDPVPVSPSNAGQERAAGSEDRGNAYYHFLLGRYREDNGDVDGAVKAYQRAAALDPVSAEIRAELAALYARQNRAREAMEWAEAALRLNAANVEAHRVLGMVNASLAKLDDEGETRDAESLERARTALRHLEAARTGSVSVEPGVEMMLGRLYMATDDTQHAIATLRRLVEQEPGRGEPIALLARAYQQAGRPEDAVALLREAAPAHPEFYASLGEVYEDQQEWKPAAAAYDQAVARNPHSLELKTRLASVLLSDGGTAEAGRAVTLLEEVRQQSPADSQVLYLLSMAQRLSGRIDEAETTARQLISIAPASLSGAYALAAIYDEKQQYSRVIETLEPVLGRTRPTSRNGSDLAPLALMLASAYEELGDFEHALSTFARARKIVPANETIDLYELGTLVTARRFTQALERSQALMTARPGDPRVVRLRAEALRGLGREGEAVKLLKDEVAAHSDDVSAHLALSEMYAAAKQFKPAVVVLQEAARLFPSDLTVRFQLGSVLDREGRAADAERTFREVLGEDPLYAPALNYLGYMMANRGERLDEAIALIRRALQVEPYNGAYLDSLGWAYLKANRLDMAEQYLGRAAAQRVRDSAVQDHYGDLLFRLGRLKDAVAAWRKALEGDGEEIDRKEIDRKIQSADAKAARQ
jgi:tetratricopeptide (TPR) repeat protein